MWHERPGAACGTGCVPTSSGVMKSVAAAKQVAGGLQAGTRTKAMLLLDFRGCEEPAQSSKSGNSSLPPDWQLCCAVTVRPAKALLILSRS